MICNYSRITPSCGNRVRWWLVALVAGLITAANANGDVSSITAEEVREGNKDQALALIIDIRAHAEFERGHIPGAINIPHFSIETKSVPPVGHVLVYGDGLGRIDEAAAALALNQKPGVTAFLLAGGLAAWESAGFQTTHPKGLTEAHVPFITYQQLEKQPQDIILADLRSRRPQRAASGTAASLPPLTDLRIKFPGARVIDPDMPRAMLESGESRSDTPGRAAVMRELARGKASQGLIVLIDDGDGSAERALFELRASGNKRVVILAGGETILQRGGRAGLERAGYGLTEWEDDVGILEQPKESVPQK